MDRIADLVAQLEHRGDADAGRVREQARTLVAEVLVWHRKAIELLVKDMDPGRLAEVASDPLVASLFELHDIAAPPPPALVSANTLLKKAKVRRDEHETSCELCAAPAHASHAHVLDIAASMLLCACDSCASLGGRFVKVPDAVMRAADLGASDAWWHSLGVPTGVALFVPRGEDRSVRVLYPGPAGATEAEVPRETWELAAREHASLTHVIPHVQALIVDRAEGAREHWICGIDRAYELVARVREPWQGLTGGEGVRTARRRFFATLSSACAEEVAR